MKNIFAKFQDYVKKPNRNTFDLSFYNNLTLKFGQLTPVFCKEVIPGDSFRINTAFGLQLMPMKFPVQTPMRAYVHYFYVRNRTLWKDWMDFIGGTKDGLTPPYVTPVDKEKFYRVGGLADYFGIPNVVYSGNVSDGDEAAGSRITIPYKPIDGFITNFDGTTTDGVTLSYDGWLSGQMVLVKPDGCWLTTAQYTSISNSTSLIHSILNTKGGVLKNNLVGTIFTQNIWNIPTNVSQRLTQLNIELNKQLAASTANGPRIIPLSVYNSLDLSGRDVSQISSYIGNLEMVITQTDSSADADASIGFGCFLVYADSDNRVLDVSTISGRLFTKTGMFRSNAPFNLIPSSLVDSVNYIYVVGYAPTIITSDSDFDNILDMRILTGGVDSRFVYSDSSIDRPVPIGSGNYSNTPYDSDIHLNALPFRAYEAIYNAYYRNPQNNPFVLNGTPEYNRYNTTYDGGADSTDYDLYFRNWEYDFLTSAVQSPQQGTAPLVGISVTGEATFQDEDGNTYYAQAILNDQGEITGWQSHSSNMPTGSLRLLMDMAGSGISINDLRNVNAFQRFLENNIRRGLKYRDQLMSHFGVKARYDELDMPEFIGGCSTSINVNKLSQTSESGDTPLGSFVGQASAFGQSKHSITHYCDEHGFIIGIMSVVPVPVYSQLLPKFFVKSQQLDYYFPEFGHIGYQPIQQKEVSPLQTFYNGSDLNKVFGYNRAWYDYLASTDEVHGQFRTTMRDFLMNRTFDSEPELSEDFLLVDPDQLNDVFLAGIDDNDLYAPESDKIIGSIYFDVSAKRPIPLFGIPKLTE